MKTFLLLFITGKNIGVLDCELSRWSNNRQFLAKGKTQDLVKKRSSGALPSSAWHHNGIHLALKFRMAISKISVPHLHLQDFLQSSG